MISRFKKFLKVLYKKWIAIYCILIRTVFCTFHNLKIPINKNIKINSNVRFYDGTRVLYYGGNLKIGENTTICSFSKFIISGGDLQIGKNCLLGEYGIYNTFDNLIIGDDVITADRVSFITNIHEYEDVTIPIKKQPSTSDEIVIGDGTWIGMNATILAGTHIGKNCVVAANCVAKGDYPDYCVIGGVPSKILKKYNKSTDMWEKIK